MLKSRVYRLPPLLQIIKPALKKPWSDTTASDRWYILALLVKNMFLPLFIGQLTAYK